MRAYVEATWGWNHALQQRRFQENFKPEENQIIMLDSQDIGLLSVQQDGTEVFIRSILILPEHQNKGIGSLIILQIIEQAEQQGYPVTLQVLKVNPARQLYEKLGFIIEGETDTHFKMRRE
jgi:GNAT superfamily N-acetyltransferase